jgi:hypothetical protein
MTLYWTSLQIAKRSGAESSKQTSSIDTLLPCYIQAFIGYHYTATYESQSPRVKIMRSRSVYRVIHVARSLITFRFSKIVWIWKLVADYNGLLQVQIKYFQNDDTSGNTGNRHHVCFFKWKGLIFIASFDSTLNFEFRTSFCQHFWPSHFFHKKAGLQGFIKKFITSEPLEI